MYPIWKKSLFLYLQFATNRMSIFLKMRQWELVENGSLIRHTLYICICIFILNLIYKQLFDGNLSATRPLGWFQRRNLIFTHTYCVPRANGSPTNRSCGRGFESRRGLIFHTNLSVQIVNQISNKNIFQVSLSVSLRSGCSISKYSSTAVENIDH